MTTDDKVAAFEGLLNEIRGALADVVVSIQKREENSALDDIAASLAELSEALSGMGGRQTGDLLNAVKAIRITAPAVNITVSPTPIQNNLPAPVVQFVERPQANVVLVHEYDRFDRIVKSTLSYSPREDQKHGR